MKSRISSKFLVVLALLTLIINIFTSFGAAFVQAETIASGYKIDVSYQNGIAKLTGNSTAVLSGYQLTTLTDDSTGQQYNPNNFSMEVTKNGTYTFTLGYTLNGISTQVQSEKVKVVVDKLATGNPKSITNTGAMPVSTLANTSTISQDVKVGIYPYENYNASDSSIAKKIADVTIPSGEFSDNKASINQAFQGVSGLSNREYNDYSVGTLVHEDGSEFPIVGVWQNNGKIYYEPLYDLNSTNKSTANNENSIGIAYEALSTDEIRLYCNLKNAISHNLDISALKDSSKFSNLNIAPNNSNNQIQAGSNVIVTFNWTSSIHDVKVSITHGGKTEDLTTTQNYNISSRKYQGTFTMPDEDTKIAVTVTNKKNQRWIGVYDNASTAYQPLEIGGSKLNVETSPLSGSTHATKAYSKVYRDYGLNSDGYGKYYIINAQEGYSQTQRDTIMARYRASDDSTSFRTNSGDSISGYLNADGTGKISYPVQDYQSGQPIKLNYKIKRGVADPNSSNWWYRSDNEYYKNLAPTGMFIDVYPQQQFENTDNYQKSFQRFNFRTYQSKSEYDTDPNKNSYTDVSESQRQTAMKAGLYPVSTTLDNGIQIIVYPRIYNPKSTLDNTAYSDDATYIRNYGDIGSGNYDNNLTLLEIQFSIVIKNAYDDIRIVSSPGAITSQPWTQVSQNTGVTEVFSRGNTNNNQEFSTENMINGTHSSYPSQGTYYPKVNTTDGKSVGYQYFKVKPKEGYSIPLPTAVFHDYKNNTSSVSNKVVSVSDPAKINTSEIGNSFIAGRLSGQNANKGLAISAKKLYEAPSKSKNNDVTNGYFYYSLLANKNNGDETIVYFTSSPINFNVTYQGFDIKGSYNVDKQRYFSIPVQLPTLDKGTFFKGWKLVVKGKGLPSDGYVLKSGSANDGLYSPNDLIDIVNIYDELKQVVDSNAVGATEYNLEFQQVVASGNSPTSGSGSVYEYFQNSANGYDTNNPKKTEYQLLGGSSFQITGVKDEITHNSIDYQKNQGTSTKDLFITDFKPVVDKSVELAKIYYDKKISVQYNKGQATGGTVPTDSNTYTTIADTQTNSSKISLKKPDSLTTPVGKEFAGWLVKAGTVSSDKTYTDTLDLSTLPDNLKNQIYSTGQVTLEATYKDAVATIRRADATGSEVGGDTSKQMNDSWIYDGKNFTITGTFKYGDITTAPTAEQQAAYQKAKEDKKIYYALYKQDPNNGVASNNVYKLWKSSAGTNDTQISKVESVSYSNKLDSSGNFTITVTIKNVVENGANSISYKWDNAARYRIYSWSAANNVDGSKFAKDGTVKATSIDNGDSTPNLPSYTTQTRVLEPFKIAGTSNNVVSSKKLMYNTEKGSISFEFTTDNGESLTKAELTRETSIVLAKIEPSGGNPKVWYIKSKNATGYYSGFTNEGGAYKPKASTPTLSISGGGDSGNKFTLTINNISDDLSGSATKWASNAHYIAYVWNSANSTPPTFSTSGSTNLIKYTINNNNSIDVPRYDLNPHIIDGNSKPSQENEGKAYNGVITYPTSARLEKKEDGKVKSSMLSIKLNGVWSNSNGTPGTAFDPNDNSVQHDYSYLVKIKNAGSTIVDSSNTQLKLSQDITNGQSFVANVLKNGTEKLTNGNLGILNFAANGSPVEKIDFKVIGKAPEFSSKDSFSGTMQYIFEKQSVK